VKKRIKNYSEKNPQTQRGCGCPIAGGIQGQAGCGSGQPGLVVGDPAHSRGVEIRFDDITAILQIVFIV